MRFKSCSLEESDTLFKHIFDTMCQENDTLCKHYIWHIFAYLNESWGTELNSQGLSTNEVDCLSKISTKTTEVDCLSKISTKYKVAGQYIG